jgi:cytidylate kinase
VLDGRDIGTVILPDASAKLFVTASAEVRALRRVRELLGRGMPATYDDVLIDIHSRDERDSGRDIAPLRQAADADLLDTSELTVEQAVGEAIRLVEARIGTNDAGA